MTLSKDGSEAAEETVSEKSSALSGKDRRESPRLTPRNGSVTSFSGDTAEALPRVAEVVDLSRGGLRLVLDWDSAAEPPVAPGDLLGFTLQLGESGGSFRLSGQVRWVLPDCPRGHVSVGVGFCALDGQTGRALDRAMVNLALDGGSASSAASSSRSKRGGVRRSSSGRRRRKLYLGEILVNKGVIDGRRLDDFLAGEYSGKGQLGAELVRQGLVEEHEVARALAEQHHLPFLDLAAQPPDTGLAATLPWMVFERHHSLPVRQEMGALLVAVACAPTLQMVEEFKAALGQRVRLGVAMDSELQAWRQRLCPARYDDLVTRELLTQDQLEEAQATAWKEGISLEAALVSFCRLPRREILAALGRHFGCPTYEFNAYAALPDALRSFCHDRRETLAAIGAVPIGAPSGRAAIAMVDPRDRGAREKVHSVFNGLQIDVAVAPPDDVRAMLGQMFGDPGPASGMGRALRDLVGSDGAPPPVGRVEDDDNGEADISDDDSAVVRLVNSIFEDAIAKGASDVHIEPSREAGTVRYRIDGVLHRAMAFPAHYRNAVVSRVKIMSDLDIAERRKPQSGKIRFRRRGAADVELRVEIVPSAGGIEDAVVRILAEARGRALSEIDLSEHNLAELKRLITMPHGLILCVGPTGSGKTTTLHSALNYVNSEDVKILTAEDPVEITQPGLRQVQVNPRAGVTFASALRSFLRADPDIIMIGEMRDRETAGIAVEASMTGHLVLSTLHTNSATETIVRLLDMGLDPYNFGDALLGVLAQRLVRRLCTQCCHQAPLGQAGLASLRSEHSNEQVFDALGAQPQSVIRTASQHGCDLCHASGYQGRLGVHELISVSDTIRDMIGRRATVTELRRQAMDEGMRTLKQDGIAKMLRGLTSLEEVRAACAR
jgi:type II secretory ATPase GspE/PulE/Tfp pilus assembly ATPase PilB-like protein